MLCVSRFLWTGRAVGSDMSESIATETMTHLQRLVAMTDAILSDVRENFAPSVEIQTALGFYPPDVHQISMVNRYNRQISHNGVEHHTSCES